MLSFHVHFLSTDHILEDSYLLVNIWVISESSRRAALSSKPTKDYFANIFSFPSSETKSWQIWLLLLLLCLRIATVVKWEKEMKDFWLQNQAFIYHFLMGKIHKILALENYSQCHIWILTLSTNFCHIKTDLSGKTVWPHASAFQKLAKMNHFWHF